jgi:protein tyrosine/serine phosphatase
VTPSLHSDRWIDLDGVVNMRDLGGLPTRGGGHTAYGRLIRSDNLQDLTQADVTRLVGELGVSDILDLRTETELHAEGPGPLRAIESLTHHHHSLIERLSGGPRDAAAAGEAALAAQGRARRDADFWADHYAGYLANRAEAVSGALAVVAGSRGATVVHCAAGKDRTGTVVALALDTAGVEHDAIIEDYALTAQRLERIIERLMGSETYAPALRLQVLEDQLPRPETMTAILTMLARDHGGGREWLRSQGWSSEDVERLQRKLTD